MVKLWCALFGHRWHRVGANLFRSAEGVFWYLRCDRCNSLGRMFEAIP